MATKTTKTEAAATGQTFKVSVGDTIVFEGDSDIFVYRVDGTTEKRGKMALRETQRINKEAVKGLLG